MTDDQTVNQTMARAVAVFIVLNLLVTWSNTPSRGSLYPPGVAPTGVLLLTLVAAWCVIDALRPAPTFTSSRVGAGLGLILLAVHVAVVPAGSPVAVPPLLHAGGAVVLSSVVAFGSRTASALIALYGSGYFVVRLQALPLAGAVTQAVVLVVAGAGGAILTYLVRRTVRIVVANSASIEREAADVEQAAARVRERARWDGLVHDKVLGALRLAAGDDGAASDRHARRLAMQALDAFRAEPATLSAIEPRLRELAGSLGVEFEEFALRQHDAPREVVEALATSAAELLTNTARHAGVGRVCVQGVIAHEGALVVVSDRGRGYDPDATAEGVGLHTVRSRMAAVGGRLELDPSSHGCTATLIWARSPLPPVRFAWHTRAFVPMILVGALELALNVALGLARPADLYLPWLNPVVAAVIAVCGVATLAVPPRAGAAWALIALAGLLAAAPLLNSRGYGVPDWRYWAVGALTPAVGVLGLRFGLRHGLACAVVMLAAVVAVEAALGVASWTPVLGPFPVCFGVALIAGMLRAGLDRATAAMTRDHLLRAEHARAAAAVAERDSELTRRRAALAHDVLPMLEALAGNARLTPQRRAECRLLEASARDQLVAPLLATAMVAAAIRGARLRGSEVVLRCADDAGPGDRLAAFRDLIEQVCQRLTGGLHARFTWHDDADELAGTATVLTDDAQAGDLATAVSGLDHLNARTTIIDRTALIEFPR